MAYYQLEDGSVYTAAQFKRKWPGGKVPSPQQRRMLGIKKITKKHYDDIRLGHLPKRYYRTTKSGKRVYDHRKNPSPSKTSYGVDTKAVTRKMKPVKRKGKTNGAIKTRVVRKNPSPVSTTMIPYRAHIVGDNIDGYHVFLKDRKGLMIPTDDRRFVSLTTARKIAQKAGVPVSRQKVTKVRTLKPRAKRKNPSHRKGSLTNARATAKNRLERMPFGSIVMVGQWLDTGKYEAKTGGGMNWKHKYFMPVEQWTSVPYKTKPGKKMVKQTIKGKNPGMGRLSRTLGEGLMPKPKKAKKKVTKKKSAKKKTTGMGRLSRTLGEGLMPKTKKAKNNPHPSSMFNENKPDWLIYAKAPGMSRFEPLDLSEGGTVKNLMYASRFPHSQESEVDSIITKLRKQAPHIKVEKRSATGSKKNPTGKKKVKQTIKGKNPSHPMLSPEKHDARFMAEFLVGVPNKNGDIPASRWKKIRAANSEVAAYKILKKAKGAGKRLDAGEQITVHVAGSKTRKYSTGVPMVTKAYTFAKDFKKKGSGRKNPPPLPSTVIPAYGRDYKTAKEAKASWNAGKDWIIADMSSPWDGKPISKRDFPKGTSVTLRFANLRKVTRVTN